MKFLVQNKLSQPVHTDMHLIIIKLFSNLKKGLYLYEQNSISGMFVFTNLLSLNIKQKMTKHLQKRFRKHKNTCNNLGHA